MHINTYLPASNYKVCAKLLSPIDLARQRIDCVQVLKILLEDAVKLRTRDDRLIKYACVRMWQGYVPSLLQYSVAISRQWSCTHGADPTLSMMVSLVAKYRNRTDGLTTVELKRAEAPWWLGKRSLHYSHRSELILNNPKYYQEIFGEGHDSKVPALYLKGKAFAPDNTKYLLGKI